MNVRDLSVLLLQMLLGVLLVGVHRRAGRKYYAYVLSVHRRVARRFPRRVAGGVGPVWLYTMPLLILGVVCIVMPLLVLLGVLGRRTP